MGEDQAVSIENLNTETETSTSENGSPYECFPQQSMAHKVGIYAMPCIIGVIYLTVVIFLIVMFYRLVRATEKIAAQLENGITVKKEESNNTI